MKSANDMMSQRLRELVGNLSVSELQALTERIQGTCASAMRAAIEALPDGEYVGEATCDGPNTVLKVVVRVVVAGSEIDIDFTGSSPQFPNADNCVLNYTVAFASYAVKCLLLPRIPNNEGCFEPLHVHAPEGSVLNAVAPCAVDDRHRPGHLTVLAVFDALSTLMPDRIVAHSGSAPASSEKFYGQDEAGRPFVARLAANGGTEGGAGMNGRSCSFPSNLANTPIEVFEARSTLRVVRKELIADSAGPGRFRGGFGQRITFLNAGTTPVVQWLMHSRRSEPAAGMLGGGQGSRNRILLNGAEVAGDRSQLVVGPGDEVTVELAGEGASCLQVIVPPSRLWMNTAADSSARQRL